jgi:hypothetical protein
MLGYAEIMPLAYKKYLKLAPLPHTVVLQKIVKHAPFIL